MNIRQLITLGALLFIIEGAFASDKSRLHISEPPVIQDIFFSDSSHGWILQNSNKKKFLLRTSDGGKTWSSLGVHNDFLQVYFNDAQIGWAIAIKLPKMNRSILYATVDGGNTWQKRSVVASAEGSLAVMISDFRFIDQAHGWFVGQGGGGRRIAVVTEDGGKSVKNVAEQLPGNGSLERVFSLDQRIWLFGGNSILASFDGGKSWKNQFENGSHPLSQTYIGLGLGGGGVILENGMGWAAGSSPGPVIISTDDFGENWHVAFEIKDGFFTDIGFGDQLHGCAATIDTRVFCTSDAGKSWHKVSVPLHEASNNPERAFWTNKVRFSGPQRVWLVGHTGELFRSDDAGQTWQEVKLP
jgi:photosystem II stability/assembly factor-like uncharacterized protein